LRKENVLGVILAGGQSRRFGQDKAAALLGQRCLIEQVLTRARPQVAQMAVSGREYGLGIPVIPDAFPSEGPLSGVLSALAWARDKQFDAVATFSCDAPFFPPDMVAKLALAVDSNAMCSYVCARSEHHPQFAVWQVRAVDELSRLYERGARALKRTQDALNGTPVHFPDGPGPGGDMFFNINCRSDLLVARHWLESGGTEDLRDAQCARDGMPQQSLHAEGRL
jgi:molybdopterin-guanine dinucleotide biosynthesis protein A